MQVHIGIKSATYPDGTKLSDVAIWNNYGTETIPPRPVFRIAAEKIIPKLKEIKEGEKKSIIETYLHNLLHQPPSQHIGLEKELLRKIGQATAAEAKRIIQSGTELQENAPATVMKKGYNKPLYETGLMIKNIFYEVVE